MIPADPDDRHERQTRSRSSEAGITHDGVQPPQVVLHLGFHKTGTTALQRSMIQRLDENGLVDRWTYQGKDVGPMVDPLLALRKLIGQSDGDYAGNITAALTESFDRFFGDGDKSLFISDETLTGQPGFGAQVLYPNLEQLLTPLAAALKGLPTEVIVVVRRQPEWLESMYIQMVQQGKPQAFAGFIKDLKISTLSWTTVLDRVRTTLDRPMVVVPYEYLRDLDGGLIDWFDRRLGFPESFRNPEIRRNVGLSEKGLLAALGAFPVFSPEERRTFRRWLQTHFPATATTRPRLLTDRGRGQLLDALAEDNDLLFSEFVTHGHELADFYARSDIHTELNSNDRSFEIEIDEIWRAVTPAWRRWNQVVRDVTRDVKDAN